MPRDEFERLERRWRERPLFLEPPPRRPLRLAMGLLVAIVVFLGATALGLPEAEELLARFTTSESEATVDETPHTAAAEVPLPHVRR